MKKQMFMDMLFDAVNDSDNLPIRDISTNSKKNTINVYLNDGTEFKILCKQCVSHHKYTILCLTASTILLIMNLLTGILIKQGKNCIFK